MTEHVTLITGATKGIGRALTERLASTGQRVIGLARNRPAASFPGRFVEVDLTDARATADVLTALAAEHSIDRLVNNVGIVRPQAIGSVELADLEAVLDLNLRPALQATQAFLPGMFAKGWGRIVNIGSLTVLGARNRTSYVR